MANAAKDVIGSLRLLPYSQAVEAADALEKIAWIEANADWSKPDLVRSRIFSILNPGKWEWRPTDG